MTNEQINFANMALMVNKLLRDTRPQWAPLYAKKVADAEALETALSQYGAQAQTLTGIGTEGYTEAKDLAEIAALDAAMPVLRGLKALQLDAPDPALAVLAAHSRTTLDALRDQEQVDTLRELHTRALARATALAAARTALKRLDVRVPNLQAELPELVAAYKRARLIVDAGGGPKPDPTKP